jgi:hypothetical protein
MATEVAIAIAVPLRVARLCCGRCPTEAPRKLALSRSHCRMVLPRQFGDAEAVAPRFPDQLERDHGHTIPPLKHRKFVERTPIEACSAFAAWPARGMMYHRFARCRMAFEGFQ